jgi:hypothetical protein
MKFAGYSLGLVLAVSLLTSSFASGPALHTHPVTVQAPDIPPAPPAVAEIAIPGPLRSFLRMAGISQQTSADEVLPLLAQMVTTRGYARGAPTEFLILVRRYLQQASELVALAGADGTIHISNCEEAKPLLAVLGYRLRSTCGPDASVQTADADRAFLTIDSGFPLADLELALRQNKPFVLPFSSSRVPALFTPKDWNSVAGESQSSDLVNSLLFHPELSRLFSALSRMDSETRVALHTSPGLAKLLHVSPLLDFYGGHLSIRSGRVLVPGGTEAEAGWKDLVGVNPESSGDFVLRLLSKDAGWLAATGTLEAVL